jgi:uncharacterized protein
MAGKFEIFADGNAKFRFRLMDDAGAVVAMSGGYEDKSAAVAGINAVRENAASGLIVDLAGT